MGNELSHQTNFCSFPSNLQLCPTFVLLGSHKLQRKKSAKVYGCKRDESQEKPKRWGNFSRAQSSKRQKNTHTHTAAHITARTCVAARASYWQRPCVGAWHFLPWTLATPLPKVGWIIHPEPCHTHTHTSANRRFPQHCSSPPGCYWRPPHPNEPTSAQSKSSDDTDVGRLIFTLDSPSSPLNCGVYLPTQLVSVEDRRKRDGDILLCCCCLCDHISSSCLWRWEMSFNVSWRWLSISRGPRPHYRLI